MITEKKQLIGGLNTDDSERLLELSDYLNMENMRNSGSELGRAGRLENIPGTLSLASYGQPGTNTVIGSCVDEAKMRVFFFVHNSNGNHGIYCYDQKTATCYTVLLSADITIDPYGGGGGLRFSLANRIHSCFFVNDCVYWTDNLNEPRKVNVERGIKLYQPAYDTTKLPYSLPIKEVNISWVRKPPIIPPTFAKRQQNPSTGSTYYAVAKWYNLYWASGPSYHAYFDGFILRVTTPFGDTYYGGLKRQVSPAEYRFDLITNNPSGFGPGGVPNPALVTTYDFTALPSVSSASTVEDLILYYTTEVDKSHYPHKDVTLTDMNIPVTLTNVPIPNSINPNNQVRYEAMQFCWRYTYWDYEQSVLSRLSKTANYNYNTQLDDIIDITLPLDEYIEQDVLQVDLVVRYIPADQFFVIKSWKNLATADAAPIMDHNTRVKALSYSFDNSYSGVALDKAYSAKKYDTVPLLSKTCALARNRTFQGNLLQGYDSPVSTSLNASLIRIDQTAIIGNWYYIKYNSGANTGYFVNIDDKWYSATDSVPPYPTTLSFTHLTLLANSTTQMVSYITNSPLYPNGPNVLYPGGAYSIITDSTALPAIRANTRVLKTDASYKLSLNFMDFASRECGIVTADTLLLQTPDRAYTQLVYYSGINWSLNTLADQIPTWATHYSVNMTKCLRTRFFLQMPTIKAAYVSKDASGVNVFTNHAYASNLVGCAFDISILLRNSMGYTYDGGSGDNVKIWLDNGNSFSLKVTGTFGNWLLTELQDMGTLNDNTEFLFEIYTPHKKTDSEPYFEQGQVFPILNPGTNNRQYSVSGGTIQGDVHLLSRANIEEPEDSSVNDTNDPESEPVTVLCEAMSPNDHFFNIWNTDAGRPDFIDTIGQVRLNNQIVFSNKYLPDTRVNGLSSYDALDADNTFEENGELQRLILANKQEEDGSVMLAICSKGPVSIYLGETQLVSNTGNAYLAQAVGVIGTKNALRGNYGTINPESVFEYLGEVYWMDMYNRAFCRYSDNGVYPISDFKLDRFFGRYCRKYLSDGAAVINARNGFSHISVCVDNFNREILVTLPATEDAGYSGVLPGYDTPPPYTPSIDNRYDFYDGKAKTISFNLKEKRWKGAYGYLPDTMNYIGVNLYGFKNGQVWRHEADKVNYNKFYGQFYPARICFVSDAEPAMIKSMLTMVVEGNVKPTFTHLYSKYPYAQATDLIDFDFKTIEGVHYAAFKHDRTTPLPGTTAVQRLIKGERIRGANPYVMAEFATYDKLLTVDFLTASYRHSSGQNV